VKQNSGDLQGRRRVTGHYQAAVLFSSQNVIAIKR